MRRITCAFIIFYFLLLFGRINLLADVTPPWSTTLNCPDYVAYADGQLQGDPPCDGLVAGGGWACTDANGNKHYEEITVDANYSGGAGGKGIRHWQGHTCEWNIAHGVKRCADGPTNNSGPLSIRFTTPQPEFWIKFYIRWQSGWQWTGLRQQKTLFTFLNGTQTSSPLFNLPYGDDGAQYMLIQNHGKQVRLSTGCGWKTMYGGGLTSDGSWHCVELHFKIESAVGVADGVFEYWLDGVRKMSYRDIRVRKDASNTGWSWMALGGNAAMLTMPAGCYAVDYDDIAISTTGYIGPLGKGVPALQ
jgi:hypothetical protein